MRQERSRRRPTGPGTGSVNLNLDFVEEQCSFPLTAQILEVIGTLKCEELSPPITSGRLSAPPVCEGNVHSLCLSCVHVLSVIEDVWLVGGGCSSRREVPRGTGATAGERA